jgi:hypothetical protein
MRQDSRDEERLDALFGAYRRVCDAAEPSVNFMPQLWDRIEGRRRFRLLLGRLTSGFVTASVVLSLGLVYLSIPGQRSLPSVTYVEALEASHADESFDFFEPVHMDLDDDSASVDEL